MTPAEIEALVEQVGDEILGRLGLPRAALTAPASAPQAPAAAWARPAGGYAAAVELLCAAPEVSQSDIRQSCGRAAKALLPAVWTQTSLLAEAVSALAGCGVRAGALVDYPGGMSSTPARLTDLETALRLGAEMVNMACGAGRVRSMEPDVLRAEVRAAAALCREAGAPLAVTLEPALLSEEELVRAAAAALAGGADALCSASGRLSREYASDRAIALLREVAGARAVVVAGGRIAGFEHAAALIAAGADRIATDDPWAILEAAPAA